MHENKNNTICLSNEIYDDRIDLLYSKQDAYKFNRDSVVSTMQFFRKKLLLEPGQECSFWDWLYYREQYLSREMILAYEAMPMDARPKDYDYHIDQACLPYAVIRESLLIGGPYVKEAEEKVFDMFLLFNDYELVLDNEEEDVLIRQEDTEVFFEEGQEKIFTSEIHTLPLVAPLKGGVRGRVNRAPRGVRKGGRTIRGRVRRRGGPSVFNVPKGSIVEKGDTLSRTMRRHRDLLRIPRLHFMTEAAIVDFTFRDEVMTHTNNGVAYVSWTYLLNDLEDTTPSGNNNIPGVTAWSTFFSKYKVLKATYSIDLGNMEDAPVNVVAWPSLTDLGVNSSTTTTAFGAPLNTSALLSAKGGMDRTRLKGSLDLGSVSGSIDDYLGNPDWGGGMVGNVTNGIWLNVGGVIATTFTTNLGMDYRSVITMTTLLTGRKNLIV